MIVLCAPAIPATSFKYFEKGRRMPSNGIYNEVEPIHCTSNCGVEYSDQLDWKRRRLYTESFIMVTRDSGYGSMKP